MAGPNDTSPRLLDGAPLAAADVRSIVGSLAPIIDARVAAGPPHGRICPAALGFDDQGAATLVGAPSPDESADYAAPEVRDGAAHTARSEVFSLASTTYTLLTGHPPNPYGFATVRRDRPDLGPAVDGVLLQATARTPELRFASATDFADALAEALGAPQSPAAHVAATPAPAVRPADEQAAEPTEEPAQARLRRELPTIPDAALPLVFLALVVLVALGFITLFFNAA